MSTHDESNSSKHICHTVSVYPTNSSVLASRRKTQFLGPAKRRRSPFFSSPPSFLLRHFPAYFDLRPSN